MEIKHLQATIHYCCDDCFKRLYGKYMRSVKRQFGKKVFHNATIICKEKNLEQKFAKYTSGFWDVKTCCKKCFSMLKSEHTRKRPIIATLKEMTIDIRIERD